MNADTVLWASIALMTAHSSFTDVTVVHGRYTLGPKHLLNIFVHQFVIICAILGVLFQGVSNIKVHLFLVSMCILCWMWFDECLMGAWQRENILYSREDFDVIQKPPQRRFAQFLSLVVPLVIIDIYKLRGSL
jgi:hypothetical protein